MRFSVADARSATDAVGSLGQTLRGKGRGAAKGQNQEQARKGLAVMARVGVAWRVVARLDEVER
jgi:hypothetical protein